MKISIITACYNSEKTIEDTILSIAGQKAPQIEHIIIDGGSTDRTLEIIEFYEEKISRVISEPDNGIYDAMNKGISITSGDIIGILNSDDVYADNKVLENVASAFADKSVGACYADLIYVEKNNLNKSVRYWKSCDYKDGLLQRGWIPPHPTFFARKGVYDSFGCFDLDYELAADFELMMRFIGKHKINSIYIPKVFVIMRLGGATNKSIKNIIKQNIEIFKSYKKNNIKFMLFLFLMSKLINRASQFNYRGNFNDS